ncbi:MAG: AAA family ATPase [Acidimicrobiia bacterium]
MAGAPSDDRRSSRSRFVGRARELERFSTALEAARAGHPTVLLVDGEAGIGKSRLLGEWHAAAGRSGASVFCGRCPRLVDASYPYAAIVDALATLATERGAAEVRALLGPGFRSFARLVPALADRGPADGGPDPADEPWGQGIIFEALSSLVRELGASAPVVFSLEDMHWADRATLDLVSFVARSVEGRGAVVVLTRRTDVAPRGDVDAWAAEMTRLAYVDTVHLGALGRPEVRSLVEAVSGRTVPSDASVESVYRRSAGNPLFVEELSRRSAHDTAPIPATLRDALLASMVALAPTTVRLLRRAAVIGGGISHELLEAVASVEPAALLEALEEAVDHRILDADENGYRFVRPLLAEAIEERMLPAERAAIHRMVADVLEERPELRGGISPGRRARHWLAAGRPAAALPLLVEAAELAATNHLNAEALDYRTKAIELVEQHGLAADRVTLAAEAAESANRAGRLDRALALVDGALAAVDPATADASLVAGALYERRAWYASRAGDGDGALEAADRALTLVPSDPPSPGRARALTARGRFRLQRSAVDAAVVDLRAAVEAAVGANASAEEGYARHVLGMALAAAGSFDEATTELQRAASIAEGTGEINELLWTALHLDQVATDTGRRHAAVDVLLERSRAARARGLDRSHGGLLAVIAAGGLVELGDWSEADGLIAGVVSRGPTPLEQIALDVVRGTLSVRRGAFADAAENLHAARAVMLGLRDGRTGGLVFDGLAELARWQGRLDDATATVHEGLAAVEHTGDDDMIVRLCLTGLRVLSDRADAIRRQGDRRVAADADRDADGFVERARRVLVERPRHSVVTATTAAAAELERRVIDENDEPGRWMTVVERWLAIGQPYDAALARWRWAQACVRADDRETALAVLAPAMTFALERGAAPLARRLDRFARLARLDVVGPGAVVDVRDQGAAPSAARRGEGARHTELTRREAEVLALVVAGRTNRQIATTLYMSEKTASVHVSRILAKLGATTRGEAAALARARGFA